MLFWKSSLTSKSFKSYSMKKRYLKLLILSAPTYFASATHIPQKPNIIFILADDMGYGDVSALNEKSKIKTPHLDKMASEGITFTDAHSSSSVSTPSRYSLLTGRYNWRSTLKEGVLWSYSKALIPEGRTTMASMLRQQGYTTACIGKWHLGWNWANIEAGEENVDFSKPITHGPTTVGFDYFYGIIASLDIPPYVYVENDMPTSSNIQMVEGDSDFRFWRKGLAADDFSHEDCLPNFTRRAVKYIEEKSKAKQPFFLYFPLPAPHTPILPTKEFQGKSGLNPYGDFVLMTDDVVGQIISTLEKQGILENTIVVFTTDNGCSPMAHIDELVEMGHNPSYIYRGHKADLYDGGHRIPTFLQWKGTYTPHQVNQTICLSDFMATFANLTGYKIDQNEAEDSYNLLPALSNPDYKQEIREATVHHSIDGDFTIRQGKWKLLLAPGSGGWSYPRPGKEPADSPKVQLYNMETDPSEQNSLQSKFPDKVEELTKLLIKYVEEGRSTPGKPQKNDGEYPWRQLTWMEE